MDVQRRREELEEIISRAEEAKRRLVVVPAEDTYALETALRIKVREHRNDTVYTYLLLKVGGNVAGRPNDGLWYHTGRAFQTNGGWDGRMFRGWDALMRWVLSSNRTILEWVELVPRLELVSPEVAVAAAEDLVGATVSLRLRQHLLHVHANEAAMLLTYDEAVTYHHAEHFESDRCTATNARGIRNHSYEDHSVRKPPMIGTPNPE